jgi:phosphoglycerate dehydrogenase-like enzyme
MAQLRAKLDPVVRLTAGAEPPEGVDYEILVAGRPDREHLTRSSDLRALIIPWAGVPQETRELMFDFPEIEVHNLHHNAVAAAEMAIALLLAAAKRIVPADRALRQHDWTPRYATNSVVLLEGKTALILGQGAIGQRVTNRCRGLGMRVVGVRRHASDDREIEIHPPEALPGLLPRADALVICLPLTAETEGLIGKKELALLPSRAVLVNVGRGPIVKEEALYHALRDGTLYAAGLDVWYQYPEEESDRSETPPSALSFEKLDNVVMSPHRAGAGGTTEIESRRISQLADLLNGAARREKMPNRVDLEAGY